MAKLLTARAFMSAQSSRAYTSDSLLCVATFAAALTFSPSRYSRKARQPVCLVEDFVAHHPSVPMQLCAASFTGVQSFYRLRLHLGALQTAVYVLKIVTHQPCHRGARPSLVRQLHRSKKRATQVTNTINSLLRATLAGSTFVWRSTGRRIKASVCSCSTRGTVHVLESPRSDLTSPLRN